MSPRLDRLLRREESLAVQSAILTAARGLGFIFTFAIPLVLVRVFDQSEFGIYKQLFLVAGTAIPILSLGLWASVFYFVPRDEKEGQRFVIQALALLCLTGGLAGFGLIMGADAISRFFESPPLREYLPLLALFVFLATPTELINSLPVADRRPMVAAYTVAGSDLLRAIGIITVALLFRTIEAVVWAAVATLLLRGIWLLVYLRLRRADVSPAVNLTDLKAQLGYSLPFAAAVLFEIGLARLHEYYVAANVSAAEFAIYAIGILQIPLLGFLVQSVVEVVLVRTAAAHRAGAVVEMRRVWKAALERLGVILVAAWAFAEVFATDLIHILFGASYLPSVTIFRVSLVSLILMMLVDRAILRATGDTIYLLKASAAGFLVSLGAVFALGRYDVLLGAVSGYLLGILFARAVGLIRVSRRLEVPCLALLSLPFLRSVGIAVATSSAVAALALTLPHPALRLSVGALLFAACYSAIVFRWELVPRREVRALLTCFIPAYRLDS